MLRQHHRVFQTTLILRDAAIVAAAFWLSFSLRAILPYFVPFAPPPGPLETAELTFTLLLLWPWVGTFAQLYISRRTRSLTHEVADVTRATTLALVALITITYYVKDVRYSRLTLALWWIFATFLLIFVRVLQRAVMGRLRRSGKNLRHVLLVGTGKLARQVVEILAREPGLGLRVVGALREDAKDFDNDAEHLLLRTESIEHVPILGGIGDVNDVIAKTGADQVLVALPIEQMASMRPLMDNLSRETVDVRLVPDFYQFMTLCGGVEDLLGLPVINLQGTPMVGVRRLLKRALDFCGAVVLLLVFSPLLLLLAILVKMESPGPVLYRQIRVGLDARPFAMLKLRTMKIDAEACGAGWTSAGDPRCTRVGRILRKLSLDELPQLINVLRGEMSLVGPRPEQASFSETFRHAIPRYALRNKIKAGMTGWAQIHGLRGDTSIAERIDFDLYYIENWSLMLDLRILVRTLFGGFLSRHAY